LPDVPVGIEQAQVYDPDIRAHPFHFLGIPEGKGIIVAVGKEDGIRRRRLQQVIGIIGRYVTFAPVMIVEILYAHQQGRAAEDRKSTRLNSSHVSISYAVFCLKKKNKSKDI